MDYKSIIKCALFFLITTNISCSDARLLKKDLEYLKVQNDSLKWVLSELNQKYIFDSISIKEIPDSKNTFKRNSVYKTEFVVIAHPSDKSNFVKYQNLNKERINVDTLKYRHGSYHMNMKLEEARNKLKIDMKVINKYGKSDKSTIHGMIKGNQLYEE